LPADALRGAPADHRTSVLASDNEAGILATALALLGDATPEVLVVAPAVTHTAEVLSTLFAAGRDGRAIQPSFVSAGSDVILQAVADASLLAWVDLVRRFDDAVHQHCMLVAGLVGSLSKSLGFRVADCRLLTQAALVHDVGKAKIPPEILNKPGPLTPEERIVIERHPALGHEMLAGKGFSGEIETVVRSHHELLDGSGYPDRLKGAEISDMVRLVTICDIFGALIERRAYKPPLDPEEALSILQKMGPKIDQTLLRASRTYLSSATSPTRVAA
jgi:putative nucleotidyltransferase with HDIG domain